MEHRLQRHDTVGQPPETASPTAGEVNTKPSSTSVVGSLNSLLVQESFTAGSATLSDQPLVWTQIRQADQPEGESSSMNMRLLNTADYEAPQNYYLAFDLLIQSEGAASNQFELRLENSAGSSGRLMRARWGSDGAFINAPSYTVVAGTEGNYSDAWEFDTVTRVEIFFHALDGTISTTMNGVHLGTTQFADWNDVSDTHKGVRDILFTTQTANGTATLGIDNIATAIPEPGTLGLGLFGLAAAAALRHRASRR